MARQTEDLSHWVFTETARDRGSARACCGLCGQRNLRYIFLVRNRRTGRRMWVGSSCILKFGLSVLHAGQALSPSESRQKLRRITRQLRG